MTPARPLARAVVTALAEAWSLVAPVDCAGCGAPDHALCPACAPTLQPRLQCAELDVDGTVLPLVVALSYDGIPRRVLLALKHEGRTELARALAPPMLAAVSAVWHLSSAEVLVPVPSSQSGAARRGFGPVALIARRAGLAVRRGLRATGGGEQKALRLDERLAVGGQRWRASEALAGLRVLLVDDVVTSGATLRAAARALIAAGAEIAGCAAIAATPRRDGRSSIQWRFMADDDGRAGDIEPVEDYREGKEAWSSPDRQAAR